MTKAWRLMAVVALLAFAMATVALAAEFYVVKGKDGKLTVVDKKPDDAGSIVKGPFKSKDEAEKALKEAAPKAEGGVKKPVKLPESGC
jgi:hypothetical protein